jgi:hypothetical protein
MVFYTDGFMLALSKCKNIKIEKMKGISFPKYEQRDQPVELGSAHF